MALGLKMQGTKSRKWNRNHSGFVLGSSFMSRLMDKGPQAWQIGMTSTVLIFTCAGTDVTQLKNGLHHQIFGHMLHQNQMKHQLLKSF